MLMQDWFDNHASYALINGTQYQVLFDDKAEPRRFWSTIVFQYGDTVNTGEHEMMKIAQRINPNNGLNLVEYRLVRA